MKHLIRWWMRRRFLKALDRADWRTASLKADAAYEVQTLRPKLFVEPMDQPRVVGGLSNVKTKS